MVKKINVYVVYSFLFIYVRKNQKPRLYLQQADNEQINVFS